ncbi:hypothetical protein B0A50_08027 [Salinomyces thailandicus]|uniref:F-box domain-containing protein n=1 Tax=Salinomyces thailandicus TaxID=706561 RepID=A0A4U0TKR7_9PEZI|nr:hypothetical protein B0A50_08027 [Salinomyces thailandica]
MSGLDGTVACLSGAPPLERLPKASKENVILIPGNINICAINQPDHRTAMDSIARFMDVPELLEMVLTKVPLNDLLFRAQLVCKGFREAIRSSPTIQRMVFLKPDHKTDPHLVVTIKLSGYESEFDETFHSWGFNAAWKIGAAEDGDIERWAKQFERFQLSRPAVKEVFVGSSCCNDPVEVRHDDGVTVGQIFAAVEKTRTERDPPWSVHSKGGKKRKLKIDLHGIFDYEMYMEEWVDGWPMADTEDEADAEDE